MIVKDNTSLDESPNIHSLAVVNAVSTPDYHTALDRKQKQFQGGYIGVRGLGCLGCPSKGVGQCSGCKGASGLGLGGVGAGAGVILLVGMFWLMPLIKPLIKRYI